jgi:uncharacterized protein (TIGR03435 family)
MIRPLIHLGFWIAAAPLLMAVAHAQPAAGVGAPPRFDTASVKVAPRSPFDYRAVLGTVVRGEVRMTEATLSECLRFAFGIENSFQIVGPDWIQSKEFLFNITGKAPPETPLPQLRLMLQNLLAERFRMTLHHEERDIPSLALVVAKNGLKLQGAKDGADASRNVQSMGKIVSNSFSMSQLTSLLSKFLGQPVLDMTGLTGWFDVKLQWTPETAQSPDEPAAIATLSAAMEEQLGLVLERRKGPLEVIVVDQAERTPIGN